MGYSCTIKASNSLNSIMDNMVKYCGIKNGDSSNTWEYKGVVYFFERGRENRDGSITGSIYKIINEENHCRKVGSVRIEPDGKVTRFPCIPKDILKQANPNYQDKDGPIFEFVNKRT